MIEFLLGGLVLAIAITAILGAYIGQVTLNEHARNLSLAIQDANRVIEQMRQRNSACTAPDILAEIAPGAPTPDFDRWDNWLENTGVNGGGGKSINFNPATPDANELIVVTCQSPDAATRCMPTTQVGAGEWNFAGSQAAALQNPMRITVAVCWRHRNRTIGECDWDGAVLTPDDTNVVANDTANVIDSPAMLTTLVTCRG